MNDEFLFFNIVRLQTPVGYFSVKNDDELIPFSVKKNGIDWPSDVVDKWGDVIGTIHTDTNYAISIDVDTIEIKKEYIIEFNTGKNCLWKFCDADDQSAVYDTIIDEWVIGIGGYDPNEYKKHEQNWRYSEKMGFPSCRRIPEYDDTKFVQYTIEPLDKCNGFRFKLYDRSKNDINFYVAWVKIGEYPVYEYEGAVGLWLA